MLNDKFRNPTLKNSMLVGFVKDDIYDEEETMNILVQMQGHQQGLNYMHQRLEAPS